MLGLLKSLFDLLTPRTKIQLLGLFGLMAVTAVLEMASVALFLPLLQLLVDPEKVSSIPIVSDFYVTWGENSPKIFMLKACVALFILFAIKNLLLGVVVYLSDRFSALQNAEYSNRLLVNYFAKPYLFHVQHNSAELIRNVIWTMPQIFVAVVLPILKIVLEILQAILIFAMLLAVEPGGTLVVGGLLGISGAIFHLLARRPLGRWGHQLMEYEAGQLQWVSQGLGAIKVNKVTHRETFFADRFRDIALRRARTLTWFNTVSQAPRLFIEIVGLGGLVLFLVYMLLTTDNMTSILPVVGVFAVAALRLMPSVNRVLSSAANVKQGAASLAAIRDHLGDATLDRILSSPTATQTITFTNEIRLENVSYRYPGATKLALDDLNLTITKGEFIAFVGPSGAGKSTLTDLLLGVLETDSGCLSIDGRELTGATLLGWQRQIGYVPQDIFLIDDTLRRNVALGLHDHEINEGNILRAIKEAGLTTVVAELPEGLDTMVGERGAKLSGGQRQRVGIARALYNAPQVLVMDEATSALDNETEQQVVAAIDSLRGEKTIIVVAHRLTTVRRCDRLFFLKDGKIAGTGPLLELAATNPDFRRIACVDSNAHPIQVDEIAASGENIR